jgi:hypothetical protein
MYRQSVATQNNTDKSGHARAPMSTEQTSLFMNPKADPPKWAALYHSYMGYVAFLLQGVSAFLVFLMFVNIWVPHSTVGLLVIVCLLYVIYWAFFLYNRYYYSSTLTSRLYWRVNVKECLTVCLNNPDYDKVIERDLKFHNDQWHFSKVILAYTFYIFCYGLFLGTQVHTANPDPDINSLPAAYAPLPVVFFGISKGFQLIFIAIAGGCGLILLETHSCFMHTTLISLNRSLLEGTFTKGLTAEREFPQQPARSGLGGTGVGGGLVNDPTQVIVDTEGNNMTARLRIASNVLNS